MRQRVLYVAPILLFVFLCSPAFAATLVPTGHSVEGEVLVKIRPGASQADIASVHQAAGADDGQRLSNLKSGTLWRLHSRSKNTDALATALQKNPNVVYVEPNYIVSLAAVPNDTSYAQLWGLKNTGQTVLGSVGTAGADIDAESAWNVTTGSASIVVGVVDTGIDYNHPDLAANIWSNPGGKGNAACAAGTHGFNAITSTCNPMDDNSHGTHVAGTIGAAGNNALGVTGVNWTTSIMGLKFLNSSGSGTTADAITAIDFAVQAKIDGVNVRVLSNSWGGGGFSKALFDEINKANEHDILFVASAGNNNSNTDTFPHFPSGYGTANMISVAATDNRDLLAYFSNYGATTVHLGAPGVNVMSTVRGTSYDWYSGTSMAAPHVAGVAALVLANSPALTTAEVKNAILSNTDSIPALAGKTSSGGRLNAGRALGAPVPPDFSVAVSPASKTVSKGTSTAYTVTIGPVGGFASAVDLSVSGLPTGISSSFNPASATSTSTLTLTTGDTTPLSSFGFTVTGVSGALTRTASALLTVVAVPAAVPCPTLSFRTSHSLSGAAAVVTGDFNRDGKADLAATSVYTNRVSILLGSGNSFQTLAGQAAGTTPLALAVGDFNGDGTSDLAVANSGSHDVSILLGSGDGSFQPAVNYAAGTSPFGVAAGDFNGDGKTDVAVANNGSSNVSILLGAGDGTLQPAVNYPTASGPFWVAAGDFDRDGSADLAVAGVKVSILLGNGDGTFDTAVDHDAGARPSAIAEGDFDADGILDLAVSNYTSGNVSVLLGDGNGTFQPAVHYPTGSGPYFVDAGDFNGDGITDLVTANSNSSNMSLLMGTGTGTFLGAIHYPGSWSGSPTQLAVGDFNADGKPDLAVAETAPGYVTILTNTGTCTLNCGAFDPATHYAAGSTPQALAAGDFNRDGAADVAVVNRSSNDVSITLGNGDGTFDAGTDETTGTNPEAAVAGDFNGDGKLDLAVANNGSADVSILSGNGDGTFQTKVDYGAGTSPRSIAAGDFNRDGITDLATANSGSNNVSILLGNGDATFQAASHHAAGTNPYAIAAGDFNRDGRIDLAVANSGSGNVSILAGNGNGTFQPATNYNAGTTPSSLAAGDFNRDGRTDLAVGNRGSNDVSILLGNSNGTFQTAVHIAAGTSPYGVTTGDFNNDGALDLAVANHGSANVSLLFSNGVGGFTAAGNFFASTNPAAILSADFGHDGKPDLAVANSGSGNVSILLDTCPLPDLAVTKTHSGTFSQGDKGRTYTITVTNVGTTSTMGIVTANDVLPSGLHATAMSGTGWTCTLATRTCTRSDALAAGASHPAITLTVNVTGGAPSSVTNQATVSGGGELNALNNSASDVTPITQITDLVVTSTHIGNFTQGDTGRIYRIIATNTGGLATSGTVTVTDTLPASLTATAMSGSGWTCTLATRTCTRSDVLQGNSSYPAIVLTVNVAANAPAAVVNAASVSGGGQTNTANDTASDPTVIWSSQTCGGFAPPSFHVTNYYYHYAIVAGDFNKDGKADLAIPSSSADVVAIRLGLGNGTFAAPVDYSAGDEPRAMAVGDFNHDGHDDLAVANYYSGNVSMLLGFGDGTFAPAVSRAVDVSYLHSLVAGDFNGDGHLDVAVTSHYYYNVYILLGTGDGTLQSPISQPVSSNPRSLTAADLNGDGKIDLVTANEYYGVWVMLGNGNGTFQSPVQVPSGQYAHFAVVGDFNRDGVPDLAVSNYYSSQVAIHIGTGSGSFAAPVFYTTVYGSQFTAVDDLNGDGKADLVMSGGSSYSMVILFGNGDGTFKPGVFVPMTAERIAIADFNGDGRADLAGISYYSNQFVTMLGGCPDLSITKTHTGLFTRGSSNIYSLTVGNVGGGAPNGTVTVTDVLPAGLSATSMTGSGWTCSVANVTCTRNDTLVPGASYAPITLTVSVAANAASNVTNVAHVAGGGDSNTANNSASDPTTIIWPSRTPADFNGDGVSDFVIWRGGTFIAYNYSTHGLLWSVATGIADGIPVPMDYDGDGRTELTVYKPGKAWHFYNDDGGYRKGIWIGVAGDIPVPADYDGDGKEDVVVYRNGTWVKYDFDTGAVVWSVTTGSIPDAIPLPMDYDGDGTAEFTVYRAGKAWHFYNDNGSYFRGVWLGVAGDIPVPGDYDGNGVDEIVVYRAGSTWTFFDLNTGTNYKSVSMGVPSHNGDPLQPSPVDYDGDGSVDFTVFAGGPWYTFHDNGSLRGGLWTGGIHNDLAMSRRDHTRATP